MQTQSIFRILNLCFVVAMVSVLAGCEGIIRKHDNDRVDISPPKEDEEPQKTGSRDIANFADLVEQTMATRETYLNNLRDLEAAYLRAGDTAKANWARSQRQQTEKVDVYPYLTAAPPEHRVEVAPIEEIPEANALYNDALDIYKEVAAIPLAGALPHNKDKAREALAMFKRILRDYPKSDKVDDAAYYTGEIYKEYLREEDPNDELSVRYYQWAAALDPNTPHPARFQCAVVYDFRRHDRAKAIEMYHQVMELEEAGNDSNIRFSATRVEQLTDEEYSHIRPDRPEKSAKSEAEPRDSERAPRDGTPQIRRTSDQSTEDAPLEPTERSTGTRRTSPGRSQSPSSDEGESLEPDGN